MARSKKAERDAKRLSNQYHNLKRLWDPAHRQMENLDDLYFMSHWKDKGAEGEGEQRITLPTATNTADMAHALLMSQKRTFHVTQVSTEIEELRTTTEIEKWLQGVFHVNMVRSGEDAVELALWDALVHRFGMLRYRWDEALIGNPMPTMAPQMMMPPEMQQLPPEVAQAAMPPEHSMVMACEELPIVIEAVPPFNIYMDWGGIYGIRHLFYAAKRTVEDIQGEMGEKVINKMRRFKTMDWEDKASERVDFIEYWGYDGRQLQTAKLIDDEFIPGHELRNVEGYRRIPYIPVYCLRTRSNDPRRRMRGVLDNIGDLLHVQEQNLTQLQRMLKMFAVMPLVVKEGRGAPVQVADSLGAVVRLKEGQDIGFPSWPGTPPDFKYNLGLLEEKIQEAGFPAISFGRGPSGISGYAISQFNEGARARLRLPRSNLQLALTQLCQGIISLALEFAPNMAIPVWGEYQNERFYSTLTGDEMKGHIVEVHISEDLPGDEVRKAMIGSQLKAQGALSDRTLHERYLGIENTEEEQQQILLEQSLRHPIAKLVAMLRVLAEDEDPMIRMVYMEVIKAIAMMKAAERGPQSQGMPTPPGSPEARPTMMPSSVAPPIAQGQAQRQEVGMGPTGPSMGLPPIGGGMGP